MPHPHRVSIWIAFVMGLAFFAMIVADVDAWTLFVDDGRRALAVSLLGTEVGGAHDRAYLDELLELLLPSVGTTPDETAGWVTTRPVPLKESIFELHARLRAHLEDLLTTHDAGFAVMVAGEPVVTVATAADAREVVTDLINRFTPRPVEGETIQSLEVGTAERLAVEPALTARAAVMSASDALAYLLAGTRERRVYQVERGEVLGAIAARNSMSIDEVVRANPGLDPDRIFPGQVVNLIVPKPLVNVEAHYVRVYRRAIPFPVSVTWNAGMYRTDVRVDRAGTVGEKEITEDVVTRNGELDSTKVLKDVVLRWPQTQFMTIGTKRTPADVLGDAIADGEVAMLTSEFGRRWGRIHAGVDWAMPAGTPVRAWRDGTVKFEGLVVGYGRLIIVEHPGDYVTYYAHLSRFSTTIGATVSAGQVIAYSGNTGNSTGPHLHFEIRQEGRPLDPIAVLSHEQPAIGGP